MANGLYDSASRNRCYWATTVPQHPHYSDLATIASITQRVSTEVMQYALDSVSLLVGNSRESASLWAASAPCSATCWEVALRTFRYGVIYFLTRRDAETLLPFSRTYSAEIDAIGKFLAEDGRANAIFNQAVARFVGSSQRHRVISNDFAPPNGFLSLDTHTLAIREGDFPICSPADVFDRRDALFDLHDLSHFVCACLSPTLYGGKHFNGMNRLPPDLLDMVLSPDFRSANALPHTDRLVFSELLNPLFDAIDFRQVPEDTVVDSLADSIVGYLAFERGVFHPTSGATIQALPVTARQLAVLAQHKTYELPASEMEQHLFTRGGADHPDVLAVLSPAERVEYIADLTRARTYHEARNTLKHRAHKEAYRRAVIELMKRSTAGSADSVLLEITNDYLAYADYARGHRLNLYDVLLSGAESRPLARHA